MKIPALALGFVLSISIGHAQYTYFNVLTGEPEDLESQSTANVEVVEDGYVVWGAGVDDGVLFHFVRKYDFSGNITVENNLIFPNEYLYSGLVNSFKHNPYNGEYIMVQGSGMEGATSGRLLLFDENLELIASDYYDQYYPDTYFFGLLIEENAYMVYGENGPLGVRGTFLMKQDFEGNVIWSKIMQSPDKIYRNWSILPLDTDGYLIAGGGFTGGGMNAIEPFGRITLLDSLGNTLSIIDYEDETELGTGPMAAFELTGGEILTAQSIYYEHYSGTTNPNVFWKKIRLQKFDPVTESFYWQQDYHGDHELLLGAVSDAVATPDGGAVILGVRIGEVNDMYTWMMKVDAEGTEEWFHEYTYDDCSNCHNQLWDLEAAPDGGYILAGWFTNYDIGPRNSTWLLKVDACGDVEWQGCEPLGLGDTVNPGERSVVYPNPASKQIFIKPPVTKSVVSHGLFDMTGKQVANHGRITASGIDVSALVRGLYILQLTYADGSVESHKVEVVK